MSIAFYMFTEFSFIFVLLPLFFIFDILPLYLIIPTVWLVSIYSMFIIEQDTKRILFDYFKLKDFLFVLKRFLFASFLLVLLTYFFFNDKFFSFAINNTKTYLLVLLLYPLLSVIPQEFIFRRFFLYRYELFLYPKALIIINSLIFGFAHIIFENYISVVLTIIGGYIFMNTYIKTKSFSLVCIEHALYGNLLFTIGLGEYFYHGNV